MTIIRNRLVGVFIALVSPLALSGEPVPDPEGEWVGVAKTPDMILELVIKIEKADGEWTGELKRPWPMPLESITVDDSGMRIVLHNQGRIDGTWRSGGLDARFAMGGIDEALHLVPLSSNEGRAQLEEAAELRAEHRPKPLAAVHKGPGYEAIDSDAVAAMVDAANEAGTSGLALFHGGELVAEWYSGGEPRPVESMSVTKPILSLGVGALLEEGRIASLDTPVHAFYPQWNEGEHAEVSIRHLLNHTSGLGRAMDNHALNKAEDRVAFALETEIETPPGEAVQYNNNAMNLLAGVIGEAAGKPADEYLANRIFEPMGIEDFEWARDEAGNPHGQSGLSILAGDLARLGQLVLQEGVWQGERLVDAGFLEEAVQPQASDTPIGLAWFLNIEENRVTAIAHSGDLGQYILILPAEKLVAVRMVAASKGYDPVSDAMQTFYELVMEWFAMQEEDSST